MESAGTLVLRQELGFTLVLRQELGSAKRSRGLAQKASGADKWTGIARVIKPYKIGTPHRMGTQSGGDSVAHVDDWDRKRVTSRSAAHACVYTCVPDRAAGCE